VNALGLEVRDLWDRAEDDLNASRSAGTVPDESVELPEDLVRAMEGLLSVRGGGRHEHGPEGLRAVVGGISALSRRSLRCTRSRPSVRRLSWRSFGLSVIV
jgi:hypothetical protein